MLPVFIINLDRRPDRWKVMSAQLDRLGIEAVRIAAIDKENLAGDPALLRLGAGHVACARSHYKAMQALVDCGAPAALILEDDVEIGDSVPGLIASLGWWPGEHGLVKLAETSITSDARSWLGPPVGTTPDGRAFRRILGKLLGAQGYLIDYDAALEVLETAPATPMPIDHLLFDLGNSHLAHSLCPVQIDPSAIRHLRETFGSETGDSRVNGRRRWRRGLAARIHLKLPLLWARACGRAARAKIGYRP